MTHTVRTALEILGIIVVSCASVVLVYWLLHTRLGLSQSGSLLLLIPATIVLAGTAVYGYYEGHQRFYHAESADERVRIFSQRFEALTLILLLLAPIVLAAICVLVLQKLATAAVFAAIAVAMAPWVIRRLR